MKFILAALALATAVLAAPIADAEAQSKYTSYGKYNNVPPPPGGYASYGKYTPPAGGYGTYKSYKREGDAVEAVEEVKV